MRDLPTIARRMLETRAKARRLEEEAAILGAAGGALSTLDMTRLLMFKGAAQMLAWALEVDLERMDSPALTNIPESPAGVTLHRVDMSDFGAQTGAQGGDTHPFWLLEAPAHIDEDDPGYSTEAWSVFLSDKQARELRVALARALTTPLPMTSPTKSPTPLFIASPSSRPPRGGKGA